MKTLLSEFWKNKRLIWDMAKDDFKLRFAGFGWGAVWGVVQPLITIVLYWFVFQVGFRNGSVQNGMPYIVWLMAGLVPWFFFSEAWASASNCLFEYSFLVKKVLFKIELLPFIKIVSSMFVHVFFIDLIFIFFATYGYTVNIYNLQIIYYVLCEVIFVYALVLITSSIAVFIRDTLQVIGILNQIFFWTIPIVWMESNISNQTILRILKLNPIYYFVEGFRNSMIDHKWFWQNPIYSLYFWLVTIFILIVGIGINKRLKKYFADLL